MSSFDLDRRAAMVRERIKRNPPPDPMPDDEPLEPNRTQDHD